MKVDFKNIPIKNLEGEVNTTDISKELAQVIYSDAKEIKDLDLALDIYKNGELELTEDQLNTVKKYLANYFKAFVQKGFEDYINSLELYNLN